MVSTVSIFEMNLIINCEHKDPHTILGMHEVFHDDREVVAVRAFLPGAKELSVIDKNDQEKVYKAERIHDDGFFEAMADRVCAALTEETRAAVLRLKCEEPEGEEKVSGVEYYEAVLCGGVRDYAGFREWRRRRPGARVAYDWWKSL